jgi:hypothetical protein
MKKIAFLCMAVLALFTACEQTAKFAVSNSQLLMYVGDEIQVKATLDGAEVAAAWTSANEAVATVEAGLVKAVAVGETTLTATYEGQTATVAVFVEELVEDQPSLEAPGAGKVTICVQVPAPLCEGSFVVIPGSLTSWDQGDAVANGQATTLVEGLSTWYVGTFDWGVDKAFKVAHSRNDGTWEWAYQAAAGKLLAGDVTLKEKGILDDMVINTDNQVIYISVEKWELSACAKPQEAGTATFNLTAVGFPAEAQFAIAGSGLEAGAWACPPPAEHVMAKVADGKYTLTLDVPATFQYKYLVDKAGDGTSWDWFSAANYNMPAELVTNDTETLPEETPAE